MSSRDPEYWTNNSSPYPDCADQEWPLRDPSLANSDHIAFLLYLGPLPNRTGLYVNVGATTVSYDLEGVRHVQTQDNWVTSDPRPLDEEALGSQSHSYASHLPAPHINYDLLAHQVLSPQEADRYEEGWGTLDRSLCERAMTLANAINQLSETYVPSSEVTNHYAVLDCIYVALKDPSSRGSWRDVGYPSPESPLPQHRRTRYSHQDLDGRHLITLCRYSGLDHGESLTIEEADLESRAVAVLGDEVRVLDRAAREVKAEAERQGRSLSVRVHVEPIGSLFSGGDQVAEQSEDEEIVD